MAPMRQRMRQPFLGNGLSHVLRLHQYWRIADWTLRDKHQWKLTKITEICLFVSENCIWKCHLQQCIDHYVYGAFNESISCHECLESLIRCQGTVCMPTDRHLGQTLLNDICFDTNFCIRWNVLKVTFVQFQLFTRWLIIHTQGTRLTNTE